eukprot:12397663-Karenia_brevis.AAC.1
MVMRPRAIREMQEQQRIIRQQLQQRVLLGLETEEQQLHQQRQEQKQQRVDSRLRLLERWNFGRDFGGGDVEERLQRLELKYCQEEWDAIMEMDREHHLQQQQQQQQQQLQQQQQQHSELSPTATAAAMAASPEASLRPAP